MITVTEHARQELKKLLTNHTDKPEAGLRLTVNAQSQLGLAIDKEKPGDQVVEHEGAKVLLVEEGLAIQLAGIALDAEDTPEGSKLVVKQA